MPILKFYKYLLYFVLIITVIGTIFLFNQQHKPTTHNTQQEASRLKYLKYHLQIKGFNFNSFDDGKNVLSIKADKVTVENKKLGFFRLGLINVAIFKNAIIDLYLSGGLETMRDVFQAFGMIRNSNDFLDVGPPYDTPAELPEDSPNGEAVRQFLAGPYITLLNEALTNLTKIGSSFNTTLTADETGSQPVEIDYGDVLMFKTMLNANRFLALIMSSYNLNVDVDATASKMSNDQFKINNDLLEPYPEFLKLINGGESSLLSAEGALLDTIDSYLDASGFIRSETDDPLDDLIAFDPEDLGDEELLRQNLQRLKASLNDNSAADLTDNVEHLSLNLNPFFGDGNGPYNLRDFLPLFNRCNDPINGTMGHGLGDDPTLGGILPNFSQGDWDFEIAPCAMAIPWIPLLLDNE